MPPPDCNVERDAVTIAVDELSQAQDLAVVLAADIQDIEADIAALQVAKMQKQGCLSYVTGTIIPQKETQLSLAEEALADCENAPPP